MLKRKIKINVFVLLFLLGIAGVAGVFIHRAGILQQIAHGLLGDGSVEEVTPDANTLLIDTLYLNIPDSSYQLLSKDRAKALKLGYLSPEHRSKVLATVRHKNTDYIAKIRLKGDLADHWSDEFKWSFRIDVKKGKAINGIKVFNLQQPGTRGYINEWVFHQLLKHQGLIHLRYRFCYMIINGKDAGLYALEEHFDKRLIENNDLREGPVFRLNTSIYWPQSQGKAPQIYGAPIQAYKMGPKKKSNPIYRQFLLAKDLIEGFKQGKLSTKEVFDVDKLAMYMAIIDLTGHHHASALDNLKFYYNPISALIEPIGYDNSIIKPLEAEYLLAEGKLLGERRTIREVSSEDTWQYSWYDRLFADAIFYEKYMAALNTLSSEATQLEFWKTIDESYQKQVDIFKVHLPRYKCKIKSILNSNASFIQKAIHPSHTVQAYVLNPKDSTQDGIRLLCSNIHSLPVRINFVKYEDGNIFNLTGNGLLQACGAAKTNQSNGEFHFSGDFPVNYGRKLYKRITLNYSVLGMSDSIDVEIFPWDKYDVERVEQLLASKRSDLNKFDFIEERDNNVIFFKPGKWVLDESLVIPPDLHLTIGEGTEIVLKNEAAIISFNAVNIVGTADAPVIISANDSTGQGLLVLHAKKTSYLEHVIFKGLSRFKSSYWELPGAVSFYESDVEIKHVLFDGNRIGDDFLNIVRSDFKLWDSHFMNVNADAFDGDFIHGEINNVSFQNVGNDGIDFSGSFITVSNTTFSKVGDKAISGGERSKIEGQHIEITDVELAITSKDDSEIFFTDITINDSRVAFCAFEKKAEFGPAIIRIDNATLNNLEIQNMIENNSTLYIDRKHVESNYDNVKEILYGAEYGKSSK